MSVGFHFFVDTIVSILAFFVFVVFHWCSSCGCNFRFYDRMSAASSSQAVLRQLIHHTLNLETNYCLSGCTLKSFRLFGFWRWSHQFLAQFTIFHSAIAQLDYGLWPHATIMLCPTNAGRCSSRRRQNAKEYQSEGGSDNEDLVTIHRLSHKEVTIHRLSHKERRHYLLLGLEDREVVVHLVQ